MIDLVFITFNRLEYTRRALRSVLADPEEEFRLFLWDNGSTDGTQAYLKNEVKDPRVADVILCQENVGQVKAINTIWGRSGAEMLGKLDNDCLVTPGWTKTIAQAHRDIPELGVCACWHFFEDDFDYNRARHKIQTFGKHRIFRHPWTCGTGLLIKNETFKKIGPMEGRATTQYWIRLAEAGYVNGFYYPLVLQDHMDDLKSEYCELKDEQAFQEARRSTMFIRPGIETRKDLWRWRDQVVSNLLDDPYEPKYYVGLRGRMRRLRDRMTMRLSRWLDRDPRGYQSSGNGKSHASVASEAERREAPVTDSKTVEAP